jgi:uncharacterized protein YkwD
MLFPSDMARKCPRFSLPRPRRGARAALLLVALLIFLPRHALAQGKEAGPEKILFDLANRDRAAQGLPPLKWNDALADAARKHAAWMAHRTSLSHQFPGEQDLPTRARQAGARFSAIAENIAEGPAAADLHAQWMISPPHRKNLLDPELDSVGISVAERDGRLFAVEDFSQALPDLSLEQQEKQLGAALSARGLHLLPDTKDARRACPLDRGYAGTHVPDFVVRYFTSDLSALPGILQQKIKSGRYRSAAVGACPSGKHGGFVQYRAAVLLYK